MADFITRTISQASFPGILQEDTGLKHDKLRLLLMCDDTSDN